MMRIKYRRLYSHNCEDQLRSPPSQGSLKNLYQAKTASTQFQLCNGLISHPTRRLFNSAQIRIASAVSLTTLFSFLITSCLASPVLPQDKPTQSIESPAVPTELEWQTVDPKQIKPGAFLFNGGLLDLSKTVPPDVKINAMVVREHCKFAQWHFGDTGSTRVGILIEIDDSDINRIFIDTNRNRIIEDSEELNTQTNKEKTWLANLDVEVRENEEVIHSKRQIGISPNLKKNSVRITTLGFAEGEIEINGTKTLVRRIDRDGNGLPNETRDQIWFDFDKDGKFNLIDERQNMKTFVEIDGRRYSVRSNRLGQTLSLKPITEKGSIQFVFALKEKQATLTTLEGSLRDEHGMLIAIRPSKEPVSVPTGRYCVESLVIEARDAQDVNWRMTLLRGLDTGWFEVKDGQEHELRLLDSIKFSATPTHRDNGWSDHLTQLTPKVSTPSGLVVTNFTNDKKNSLRGDNSVGVKFKIQSADTPDAEPDSCQSGFF